MMLDYNKVLVDKKNLRIVPQYLHLVIASEIEPDDESKPVKTEVLSLQRLFLDQMK